MKVNSDIIKQARKADLVTYLDNRGYSFIRKGNRHRCVEHKSLVITNRNAFFWNSKQEHGNSVDFLIKYEGMDFKTAVKELTNEDFEHKKSSKQVTTAKSNYIISKENLNRAYAYLNKQRKLNTEIISNLIEKDYLKMIHAGSYKYPVIAFTIFDENKQIVGYEVQGTLDKVKFKGMTEDAQYGYGFNFGIGTPRKAFFFESPIDLISFYQLWKFKHIQVDLNNSLLVSLGGLKTTTLTNMLKAFKIDSVPSVCVDNDAAGAKFKETLNKKNIAYNTIDIPDLKYKDWNEYLIK